MRSEIVALALIVAAGGGCGRAPVVTQAQPVGHSTAAAELAPVEVRAPFVGTVEIAREVKLVALATGRVTQINVADGGEVVGGGVIIRLGGDRFEAAASAAGAAATAAQEVVAARRDQLERAQRRETDHLADPAEVSDAQSALSEARKSQVEADSKLQVLAAAAEIRAPFAGRLVARSVTVGQDVAAGASLADLVDPASARILAAVVGGGDHPVTVGQDAWLQADNEGKDGLRVAGLATSASNSGTPRVWLTGEPVAMLPPGTAVSGWIVTDRHDGIVVPADAVVRDDRERPYVFVGREAPFERRPVAIGVELDDRVEVTSGLAVGEVVVTGGAYELLWESFKTSFTPAD